MREGCSGNSSQGLAIVGPCTAVSSLRELEPKIFRPFRPSASAFAVSPCRASLANSASRLADPPQMQPMVLGASTTSLVVNGHMATTQESFMPKAPLPPQTPNVHDADTWPGEEHTQIYATEDAPTFPDFVFDNLLTGEWTRPVLTPTKG